MKSALASTALMGLVAVISMGAASYFYPWPKISATSDMVNKALFEKYDYNQVRSIEIVQFNRDTNALEKISMRRSGEKWVIPAKDNFVVTQSTAISSAVDSLNERTVLEIMSDQQQDHFEYGVVDPDDYQSVTNLSGLGARITLSDRNNKTIASMIVGKSRKNDPQQTKRFVRVPGQPQVYFIDFNANVLSTDFRSWVNPNLANMQTRENPSGNRPTFISINNYRIDPANIALAKKEHRYSVEIDTSTGFAIQKILMAAEGENDLKPVEPNSQQVAELGQIGRFLGNILFSNVVKKDRDVAAALLADKENTPDTVFSSMAKFGFRKTGFEDGSSVFESTRGTMTIVTSDGVGIQLLIGNTTGNLNVYSGKPDRYLMMKARVKRDYFPLPEKPEVEENSDENKAYLRAVEERNGKIKLAGDIAKGLNQTYSDWYYVIDDTIADGLIPDVAVAASVEPPAAEEGAAEADPRKD